MVPCCVLLPSFCKFLSEGPVGRNLDPQLLAPHLLPTSTPSPALSWPSYSYSSLNPEPQAWAETMNNLLLQVTCFGWASCPQVGGQLTLGNHRLSPRGPGAGGDPEDAQVHEGGRGPAGLAGQPEAGSQGRREPWGGGRSGEKRPGVGRKPQGRTLWRRGPWVMSPG